MRRIVGMGGLTAFAVVAAWRAASEVLERRALLARTGELDLLLQARRERGIAAALTCVGLREPAPLPVAVVADPTATAVHASVHVGSVRGGDIDDVGLLEGAMRRAAAERMEASAAGLRRRPARITRRARPTPVTATGDIPPAADQAAPQRRVPYTDWRFIASDDPEGRAAPVPRWAVPAAAVAVLVSLAPLVRPLSEPAPWLAIAGIALVGVAWFAARRD